jgi:hypothetical protein
MQQILKTANDIKRYVDEGKNYPFPKHITAYCPFCKCITQFNKHGFYLRYFISQIYVGLIYVRRYICCCKKATVSLLPSFCIFKKALAFENIFAYTHAAYFRKSTLKKTLEELNKSSPNIDMSRQLLYFYRRRWKDNMKLIESVLRQIKREIVLPDNRLDINRRAKALLGTVKEEFRPLEYFTNAFFEKTNKSPFALIK